MLCPKCKTDSAHRSHRRTLVERLVGLFSVYPYRCRGCENRFLRFRYSTGMSLPGGAPSTEREVSATRRAMEWRSKRREMLLFGGGFLLFLLFLYYVTGSRGTPSDDN